jgi:glycosyltransferase involved in cell wall biosynthesis
MRLTCKALSDYGHSVSACYTGVASDPDIQSHPQQLGVTLRGMWPRIWAMEWGWKRRLRKVIDEVNPDLVIAQQMVLVPTAEVCRENDIPMIALVQSVDHFCLGTFWTGHPWKCEYKCVGCKDSDKRLWQLPFFLPCIRRFRDVMPSASAVVSNSAWMQGLLRDIFGIRSTIIPPLTEFTVRDIGTRNPEKILFFSPTDYKGVGLAMELADNLKDEKFLFVGNTKKKIVREISKHPNIEYVKWLSSPAIAYRDAKLLIFPSQTPESYGMVCIEAMSYGIPCVVSDAGALPDTVGPGGDYVSPHKDLQAWIKTLLKYKDKDYLLEKSKAAASESRKYSAKQCAESVVQLVNEVLSRKEAPLEDR